MKKKILIISYKIPYPLNQGGAIAQYYFLNKLTFFFDVTFCTKVSNQNVELLKKIFPKLKILIYEDLDEAMLKQSFVLLFLEKIKKINKRIKNKLKITLFGKKLVSDNIHLDNKFSFIDENFHNYIVKVMNENSFDFVQLEFFETIPLLPIIPNGIKKIFICHEIRSKKIGLVNISNKIYRDYIKDITLIIENSLLKLADKIIVFNNDDKFFFKNINSNVIVSPFGIPEELILKKTSSNFFYKFIFLGSEFHYPNKEGLEWFLDSIFLPNQNIIKWNIYITSNWSNTFRNKYKNNKNIVFTGHLDKLEEIYDNAILVAPIISGSGVRTKILEAFANRVPVIATPFASEGLYDINEEIKHIIHFETETDFVKKIIDIKDNPKLISELAENGFNYFSVHFNDEKLFKKRFLAYN